MNDSRHRAAAAFAQRLAVGEDKQSLMLWSARGQAAADSHVAIHGGNASRYCRRSLHVHARRTTRDAQSIDLLPA